MKKVRSYGGGTCCELAENPAISPCLLSHSFTRLARVGIALKLTPNVDVDDIFSLSVLHSLFFSCSPSAPHGVLLRYPPLPLMMQACSGSPKDSSPCTCSSFAPRPPPKEKKCSSCGHRRSAHNDCAPKSDSNNKYVKRLLKNITATAVHEEARKETVQGFRPQQASGTVTVRATLTLDSQCLIQVSASNWRSEGILWGSRLEIHPLLH